MTAKPEKAALNAYFAEGDSWAQDHRDLLYSSRRIAWIIAAAAGAIALLEALALILLTPLKTVQPYTLLVDRQTGFVQALNPLQPQTVSSNSALTQSFLVQYIIAREGYDASIVQTEYRKVALWSAGTARSTYLADMQASSPNSPLTLYPRTAIVDVQVKSVTSVGRNKAMVRFDTRRVDAGGQSVPARAWVAYVRYAYSNEPMSTGDRFINPLGFKVTAYRRSMEVLPAAEPAGLSTTSSLSSALPARAPADILGAIPSPLQAIPRQQP